MSIIYSLWCIRLEFKKSANCREKFNKYLFNFEKYDFAWRNKNKKLCGLICSVSRIFLRFDCQIEVKGQWYQSKQLLRIPWYISGRDNQTYESCVPIRVSVSFLMLGKFNKSYSEVQTFGATYFFILFISSQSEKKINHFHRYVTDLLSFFLYHDDCQLFRAIDFIHDSLFICTWIIYSNHHPVHIFSNFKPWTWNSHSNIFFRQSFQLRGKKILISFVTKILELPFLIYGKMNGEITWLCSRL